MSDDLQTARDDVWEALGAAPLRRAVLGRDRADAMVRVALDVFPTNELAAAGQCTRYAAALQKRMEFAVRSRYSERCGFAFSTLILSWAISAIVQALVVRWWKRRQEVES